jgi:hypothetical protein
MLEDGIDAEGFGKLMRPSIVTVQTALSQLCKQTSGQTVFVHKENPFTKLSFGKICYRWLWAPQVL